MADSLKLSRINKFYGGVVNGDFDRREGGSLVCEEIDVFTNQNYIEATRRMAANNSVVAYGIFDYAFDGLGVGSSDGGCIFAFGRDRDTSNPLARIWRIQLAHQSIPQDYDSFYTSANRASGKGHDVMAFHQQTESSTLKRYVYFVGHTTSSGMTMRRYGDLWSSPTESSTDTSSTTMLLTGITTSNDVFFHPWKCSISGELFIGHGQYIAKIDDTGVFTEKAFTLPTGFGGVYACQYADSMFILAKNLENPDVAKIFVWDLTATTGFDDQVDVPMGGPQFIVNHNEVIRVCCSNNGVLRLFELTGKFPTKTHELSNVQPETFSLGTSGGDMGFPVGRNSVFIRDGILYFSVWKTDKSGIYALGQVEKDKPYALVLAKRFIDSGTSGYDKHRPLAAIGCGPNFYASYFDTTTAINTYRASRVEGNNSPTRSSDAVYESVYIGNETPETNKDWVGAIVTAKAMPDSTAILVDCRTDNASSYDSNALLTLDNTNDSPPDGGTSDRFWYREWTSVTGRILQVRIRFTSSGTSTAKLYSLGIFSRDNEII